MRKLALLPCVLVCACGGSDDVAFDGLPAEGITTSARYSLTTTVDLTAAAVLPEPISDYLDILTRLRDDPGGAFFDLLEVANVPLVDELRAVLPGAIEDRIGDFIGDAIDDRFYDELDALIAESRTALARFDLVSELELPPADRDGRARAAHALRALRFRLRDRDIEIPVPALDDVTAVALDARVTRGRGDADAHLVLGAHAWGVGYGEIAFTLLDRSLSERYSGGLRGALGELVDCPAVAARVAARCVLGVCVGHRAQLEDLCESGLDEAVAALHDQLADLRFDAVSLDAGDADMWDGSGDGATDLLQGVWQLRLDAGMGPRSVPATFRGERAEAHTQ